MFYAIGNIFGAQPRTAEHTDTRQALQHHDPEYQRRQKKQNRKNDDQHEDLNDTVVSVEALQIFLQKFLKTAEDRRQQSKDFNGKDRRQSNREEERPEFTPRQEEMPLMDDTRQKSAQAARAAYAYQSMQRPQQREKVLLETTDQGQGPEFDLSAADIRAIYGLLEDIKILTEKNIDYLHIETADTFLNSLTNAVGKVLNS